MFDRDEIRGKSRGGRARGVDQPSGNVLDLGDGDTRVEEDDDPDGEDVEWGSCPRYLRQLDWKPVTRSSRPRKLKDSCSMDKSRARTRQIRF